MVGVAISKLVKRISAQKLKIGLAKFQSSQSETRQILSTSIWHSTACQLSNIYAADAPAASAVFITSMERSSAGSAGATCLLDR